MMRRSETRTMMVVLAIFLSISPIFAGDLSIGADVVSRYVWRGTDFGNAAAVQPGISYSIGSLEVGAWGSWAINGAADGNENDLYASYSIGSFAITLTDYFFPGYTGDDLIDDFGEEGGHTFEIGLGYEISKFSFLAAMNVAGSDTDNSKYAEIGYSLYSSEEMSASLFAGIGDYAYVEEDDFNICNVGLSVSKGAYSAAYIINPDKKTSFLTFCFSL